MRDAERIKQEAAAGFKAVREKFKAAGGDMNALAIVQHLQKCGDNGADLLMRETVRYAAWLDLEVGTQSEMFAADPVEDLTGGIREKHNEWKAEQAGYFAGKAGEPIDNNPNNPGTTHHVQWREGWHKGQAALAMTMKKDDDEASEA